jgi:YidC/Oxa1 family membrane protein insertase
MEKRLVLAITLSLLVLLTWSLLVPKPQPIENKEVATQNLPSVRENPEQTPLLNIEQESKPSSLFKYEQDKLEITFIESLAAIKEIKFKAHQDYRFPLKYGFLLADNSASFKKESSSPESITFVQSDQNKKIKKEFLFSNSGYSIWLEIEYQNLSNLTQKVNLPLILGVLDFSPRNTQARYQDVTLATKDKILHLNARRSLGFPEVKFLSLRDRYFCAIVGPSSENFRCFINKVDPQTAEIGFSSPENVLAPGERIKQKFHIYLGPQDLRLISSIKSDWSAVVNYGTFDFIAQIILQLLEFLHRLVHNWGGAIVILSILVYLLLYPLTLKQMRSMKEMQALQPHIEELRKLYKDNPQRMNKETMELYRQHKVNPLGGCLPLILQMPIFIALWQALQRSVVLKGASFLWIKDLSEPDRLFTLTGAFPIKEINILPIFTAVLMLLQQKISTVPTSGSSAEQQKLMAIMMPIIFGLAFYNMPSGWVLYFLVYSLLALGNQLKISKT